MDQTFDRPDLPKLTFSIVRASARGLFLNTLFIAIAALVSRIPQQWIDSLDQLSAHGFYQSHRVSAEAVRFAAVAICAAVGSMLDLILYYRPMHRASTHFSDDARFSYKMARKILGLDTRGADDDKEWAKRTLEGTLIAAIGGFLVQFAFGIPLFVIISIGPWIALASYLQLNSWLTASFVLLKLPGIALAVAELSALAFHTWRCRLRDA